MIIQQALELALQHHRAGRLPEAEAAFRQILALEPRHAEALHSLGLLACETGGNETGVDLIRQAIAANPEAAHYHNNLGNILCDLGRLDEAIGVYRRAIELKPDLVEAHNNLATALSELERHDEAIAAFRRAIELKPDLVEAHTNMGTALVSDGRPEEAEAAHRRAIELQPDFAEAHNNLGVALKAQRRLEEAAAACRRALELKPDFADARWNFSLLLLLGGDFERGWPLYEARWDAIQRSSKRNFPQPRWDGGPLDGRRLLLHAEQGFGDAIQFVRYAARIADLGGVVTIECQRPLVELLGSAKGVNKAVAAGDPLPPFDLHLPMLSLPLAFKTTLETIPREVPYLFVDPARCVSWRARLGRDPSRLRVGLGWAGNPKHRGDRFRSIRLHQLLPLLNVQGVDFFSLQRDRGSEEIQALPAAATILDHTKSIACFADTAAMLMQLDLVISVDTAVVHLAGALGRPVWTLLAAAPDWRWMLERTDSPWYPTMRLFRQTRLAEWEPVVAEVREQLQLLVNLRK